MKLKESKMTSKFGTRTHPITGTKHYHRGVDLVSEDGQVYAGMRGKVIRSQKGKYGEGNYIQTRTTIKGIAFYVNYFHNEDNYVDVDDYINVDDRIAKQGSTGESTGIHTHFEIYVYNRDLLQIQNILEGVKYHTKRMRTFFNPFELIEFLKLNYHFGG